MRLARLVAAVFLVLVGCSTSQIIHNVGNAVVFTGSGSQPTLEEIRRAIVVAATSKGWSIRDIDSENIQATLNLRKHMAQVMIAYSTRSYSITYKDSHTLDYDGTMIHRSYNKWVRNLEILINRQLGLL